MADWAVIEEGQHAVTLEASALAQAAVAIVNEHGTVERSPSGMLDLLTKAAESEGLNPDRDKGRGQQRHHISLKIANIRKYVYMKGTRGLSYRTEKMLVLLSLLSERLI